MKRQFVRFVRDDQGQDLIEYALLATLIALAAYAGANLLGANLNLWYTNVATWVGGAAGAVPPAP